MNLTEPDAGSDVGALRTKAVRQDDGTYRITGQKIFITYGEHDFTDNIVHLVLARTPDAPAGTKGISLLHRARSSWSNDDGTLGERNDVKLVSIEHKMGIKASPTCVLAYGDDGDGAVGYLIGEENAGMRYMFTMMNNARLGVGVEGLGLAERGYQRALDLRQRAQAGLRAGRGPGREVVHRRAPRRAPAAAHHEGLHRGHAGPLPTRSPSRSTWPRYGADEADRTAAQEMVDLLIPLAKSCCTDVAEPVTSIGIQVHGGMGFIEETGAPSTTATPRSPRSTRAPTASRPWTSSAASCRCGPGPCSPDQIARMRATVEELDGGDPALAAIHDELAARRRRAPSRPAVADDRGRAPTRSSALSARHRSSACCRSPPPAG